MEGPARQAPRGPVAALSGSRRSACASSDIGWSQMSTCALSRVDRSATMRRSNCSGIASQLRAMAAEDATTVWTGRSEEPAAAGGRRVPGVPAAPTPRLARCWACRARLLEAARRETPSLARERPPACFAKFLLPPRRSGAASPPGPRPPSLRTRDLRQVLLAPELRACLTSVFGAENVSFSCHAVHFS